VEVGNAPASRYSLTVTVKTVKNNQLLETSQQREFFIVKPEQP
jgi:hypothetical protein